MSKITTETAFSVLVEVQERMYDIPFDNSQFQNENFIINSALTPERAYRSAALRLQDRLNALKTAYFTDRKETVKVKQLQAKLELESDMFEKELIEIELEEIASDKEYKSKLINDAIVEANQLYGFIQSCPKYTREEFEASERKHFELKLLEDVSGVTGAIKSLSDMGVNLQKLSSGIIEYANTNLIGELK